VLGPRAAGPADLVGGKAMGLAWLDRHGARVPAWITVTTRAADLVLGPLAAAADGEPLVGAAPWPASLETALARALARLDGSRGFAVRSSAVGEDGTHASHAGQLLTLVGVTADRVPDAVRACWAAAHRGDVATYRRRRGDLVEPPRIAVVVQEMVDPDAAGVAFTADPRTGAPAYLVVAAYGLGEGVVSDRVTTDLYVRPRGAECWQSTVARKTHAVRLRPGEARTELRPVPATRAGLAALGPATLAALGTMLGRLERAAGRPLDVEWAVDAAGAIHILQARPLTALPSGPVSVWDDANIGENFPGVTLPLTATFVQDLYGHVFGQVLREVGVPARTMHQIAPALRHLLDVIRGRLYMNLRTYYRMFVAVPGVGWTTRPWETALGVDGSIRPGDGTPVGIARVAAAVRTGTRLLRRYRRLDAELTAFRAQTAAFLERWSAETFDGRPLGELADLYDLLRSECVGLWTSHVFNDLFLFVLNDWLARVCGDAALHQRLASGVPEPDSLAPLVSLHRLARLAAATPSVRDAVAAPISPEEAWRRIGGLVEAEPFRAAAAAHVARFGDRMGEELKLENGCLGDAPWRLVPLLRAYADAPPPEAARSRQADSRAAAEAVLRARLARRPLARRWAALLLPRVRRGVAAREYMSFARARAFGVLRRLVRAIGTGLTAVGVLRRPDDLWHLTMPELLRAARDPAGARALAGTAARRAAAYDRFRGEQLPHRLVCRGSVYRYTWQTAVGGRTDDGRALAGTPSSPGVARGPARVLHTPDPTGAPLAGAILVAPATEPSWMFLIYAARGVVVERGSVLSHAAIIGRELGIPTVVGVRDATTRIRDGDLIEVDGSAGTVRVLERTA
jgi:phosphohistidine swiveling domain-containing protein